MESPDTQTNFFHEHTGCLDDDGKCHAFCFRTEIIYVDGSAPPMPLTFCPNEAKHPGEMLDLRKNQDGK